MSKSNVELGKIFEQETNEWFLKKYNIQLKYDFVLKIGIESMKKEHKFDLGSNKNNIIIECKTHKWTSSGNVPSGKMSVWNEAMYYFHVSPPNFRKIMFVLKDYSKKRNETLAQYYLKTNYHLIPNDVEFWEYDKNKKEAKKIK